MDSWEMPSRSIPDWDDPTTPPGTFAPAAPQAVHAIERCHRSSCWQQSGEAPLHAAGFRHAFKELKDRRNPNRIKPKRKGPSSAARRAAVILQGFGLPVSAHTLSSPGHRLSQDLREEIVALPWSVAFDGPNPKTGKGHLTVRTLRPDLWDAKLNAKTPKPTLSLMQEA